MDPLRDPLTEAELDKLVEEQVHIGETIGEGAQVTRVIAPDGGNVVREDGTIKVAIMRPCVSRGKRIRNLPPAYAPSMLAENAGVFTGWPMFGDHAIVEGLAESSTSDRLAELGLQEADALVVEAVKKIGRSIDDVVGRVLRSWYDPELVYEDDSEYEYQPGGVVGYAKLVKALREKVADDPGLLHLSINAYPKSGRPGFPAWAPKLRAMMIEGIRKLPQGSVDVVVRGGAGGRFLREHDAREVSSRSRYYSVPATEMDLSKMTPEQLREHVEKNAPHLLPALREASAPGTGQPPAQQPPPAAQQPPATGAADQPLTEAALTEAIKRSQEQFAQTLQEREEALREEADKRIAEERENRELVADAHKLIEAAERRRDNPDGFLPGKWVNDLKARYALTESGASPALAAVQPKKDDKGVELSRRQVLAEAVKADLDYAQELVGDLTGRKPVVRSQGGGGTDDAQPGQKVTETQQSQKPAGRGWDDDVADMGIVERDEKTGEPVIEGLLDTLAEGVMG